MLSKKEVKDIQSLAHKKFRDETGLFVAEGPKIVSELIELAPGQVACIYATEGWLQQQNGLQVPVQPISPIELQKISGLQTPNEVVAVLRQWTVPQPPPASFSLYLDTLQDPGNFGTIIRIADWFGIGSIICSAGCADLYNPKVVQSTMASIARVPVFYEGEEGWLQAQEGPVYAATLSGRPLYEEGKTEKGVLIIGNESRGIRPHLIERATRQVTIPRRGGAESLNAAVATGIILSHLIC